MQKPIAIVLGGTVPHISLLKKLKERGYHTILIDYFDDPPARKFADEHVKESTLDKEKVLEIAQQREASLVISTCIDQANSICCYVAEKLSLPHPYSYQTSLNVTDKRLMKQIMWDNNIPTSRYVEVGKDADVSLESLRYPLMVKPADSNSANGVKKVINEEELNRYLPEAKQMSRNGNAIVEEFVEGVEISAYCVVIDGKAHLLMAQERNSISDGADKVIKCYSSHAPARISEKAMAKCEPITTAIAKAFGLDNTPLFFQGIVHGDEISVIEFAPRVGGGISSQTILYGTGYDIIDAAIDSFLGEPLSLENWHPMDKVYAVNQIYGTNGIYSHTIGGDKLLEDGVVDNLSFYKTRGAEIEESRASSSRIGVMVFSAENDTLLRQKIKYAFNSIDCFDINGHSIIRKDLNLDNLWDN